MTRAIPLPSSPIIVPMAIPGRFRAIVAARLGLELSPSFDHRLEQAWAALVAGSAALPDQHLAALEEQPISGASWQAVIARVTVAESRFHRDQAWWHQIETMILAKLIAREAAGRRRLRLWSAGCAGGEEPYTLAMLIDRLVPDRTGWDVRIFGTDINQSVLDAARKGSFGAWAVRELDAGLLHRHFVERSKRFEVAAPLGAMVEFRCLNLVDDDPAFAAETGPFDLILCRNVLMYWSKDRQQRVVARFMAATAPDGWIVTSPAESAAELFAPMVAVNTPDAILFHARSAGEGRQASPEHRGAIGGRPPRPFPQPLPRPLVTVARPSAASRPAPVEALGDIVADARRHADRGEFGIARRRCEAALARDAVNWEANLLLAHVCEEVGDLPAAVTAARRSVYLRPDSALAHFRLGNAQLKAGRPAPPRPGPASGR